MEPVSPAYRDEPGSPAYRERPAEPVSPAFRERPVEPVSPAYPDGPRRGEPPVRERFPEPERRTYREEQPAAFQQPAPPRPEERRDERPVPPRYAEERPAAFREPVRPADERPVPFREPVQPPVVDVPDGPRRERRPAAFQGERIAPPPAHVDELPTAPLSPPPPRRPERDGGTPEPWLATPPPPFAPEPAVERDVLPPVEDSGAAEATAAVRVPAPRSGDSAPAYPRRLADDELHAASVGDESSAAEPAASRDDVGWFAAAADEVAATTAPHESPVVAAEAAAKTEPAAVAEEAAAPVEPAAAAEPQQPTEIAEPPKAAQPVEPPKAAQPVEPPKVAEPVEPPKVAEPVEPPKTAEPVEPPKAAQLVEPPKAARPVEPPKAAQPVEPPKTAAPVEPNKAAAPVEPPKAAAPVEPPPAEVPVEVAQEPVPAEEPEAAAPADPVEKAAEPVEPVPAAKDQPAKPKPPVVDGLRLDLHEATRPVSTPPAEPAAAPAAAPAPEPAAESVATSADEVDPGAVEAEPVAAAKAEPAASEPVKDTAEIVDAAPADSAAEETSPAPSPVSPDETETTEEPDEIASADTVLPVPEGTAAGAATALRAPTMLHPVVATPEPDEEKPEQPKDPEQVLAAYQWRFHHETLRELVEDPDELRSIRDQLTAKVDVATDNAARARLLSLRAVVSRILGDLGKALSDGKLALAHAEATGELRRISIAQARLAHVLQWRGDYAEADRLNALANSPELPDRLRATMHEHAGRSCYDQGRYIEACNHFEKALDLRKVDDPELIARTEQALDAVLAKVATNGLGPYPRDEDEILQLHKPPKPHFSEKVQRWGYVDAEFDWAIAPSYAEVQPFKEGVAWVRRPETEPWELIDESGEVLIFASLGYLGVGSFHDGLAWVSHNGRGNWLAIEKSGEVAINIGFEDVRPFRGGVAAVKRGAWGAIDKNGRTVLPPQYSGFSTALTDGRYVDGFTDEGLAVVDSGGRKGVVDRNGRVLVPPRFPALVIHPVAFLVGGGQGLWGALDRRGEPLIDIVHGSRAAVTEEIDRLLADTKPVL
ncbi:hypothetical protein DFJ67_8327 [Asanoa ferruginea]|uniref:WG repeat protein n=1 Tax=Asanoa ferruginea TaxID=53367 RepID=A0A3D9ZZX4_9ACTN|nr:WG repeat-containing protein [Asanoa ferruginea]REG02235.1 hypothetical protein DFJ67_8327 [Asanoa ferruginea]